MYVKSMPNFVDILTTSLISIPVSINLFIASNAPIETATLKVFAPWVIRTH